MSAAIARDKFGKRIKVGDLVTLRGNVFGMGFAIAEAVLHLLAALFSRA